MKIIIIAAWLLAMWGLGMGYQSQQPKPLRVEMSLQEWQAVVDIIDNSATEGGVRKTLIYKIQTQVNAQIKQADSATQKVKIDTTKTRKKP